MDKNLHSVRRTSTVEERPRGDRRVRRTTRALTHALIDLVFEKRYDTITIQNLLDRADVGRSTFYSHYRGKDDLLFRSFEAMLERLDETIDDDVTPYFRAAPVRELFSHVENFRRFHQRLARARMLDRLYQAGTDFLSGTISSRLAAREALKPAVAPLEVVSRAYAGALFALLRWWLDHGDGYTAEQMDELYHRMLAGERDEV